MKRLITPLLIIFFVVSTINTFARKAGDLEKIDETIYFEFHSNYLMNLHHFLIKKGLQLPKDEKNPLKQFDVLFKDEVKTVLRPEQKMKVMQAIQFYADSISSSNLLFDPKLTTFKYSLQSAKSLDALKATEPIKGTVEAMERATRFYGEYCWQVQDKKNRSFISGKIKLLKQIEKSVLEASEKKYVYQFDGKKFRIDLVDYATFYGAYTTTEPYVNAVISSTDKKHEGTQGIEIIFHEVAHSMMNTVFLTQEKLCKELGMPMDHNVWHIVLFYTTGQVVKAELQKQGAEHEIYLYKNKLGDINPVFRKLVDAVTLEWQSYLDGKLDMDTAMSNILKK